MVNIFFKHEMEFPFHFFFPQKLFRHIPDQFSDIFSREQGMINSHFHLVEAEEESEKIKDDLKQIKLSLWEIQKELKKLKEYIQLLNELMHEEIIIEFLPGHMKTIKPVTSDNTITSYYDNKTTGNLEGVTL